MNLKDKISNLLEHWFIQEPALFQVICSHEIVENYGISCPVRSGKRRLEYNPDLLSRMTDVQIDNALKTEAIRIILKHPYERKPDQCCDQAVAIGSDITIGDNYKYSEIDKPSDYKLKEGMPYEWYSRRIQEQLPPSSGNGDGGSGGQDKESQNNGGGSGKDNSDNASSNAKYYQDKAELWQEDELTVTMINGIIDSIKEWGSIGGRFAEMIKASTKAKINWRNIFSGFRASVLTSKRRLTRMRPNRRSGFEQMGSTREFTTKLLVAVDVSGSITSQTLSYFYGVINSAFKYGFEAIDVIQFDCGITAAQNLKKAPREIAVVGRGGTSFQEPIDFAIANNYEGLVILTDGYAPVPDVPTNCRTKILWVCDDKSSYEAHHSWMEKIGRVCVIDLK